MCSSLSYNNKKIDIAIFSAMPEELEHLFDDLSEYKSESLTYGHFEFKVFNYKNLRILTAHTGLGTTFAASVVTMVCQQFRPDYLFMAGTAGGIKPGIQIRDVVIVEGAFEAEIQGAFTILKNTPFEGCLTHPLKNQVFPSTYYANKNLLSLLSDVDLASKNIHKGTVVSSNTFPSPKELFEQVKSKNPISIDMETSAFYQVAWLFDLPALAIRGISNVLDHDGTDENVHESDVSGSAKAASRMLLKIIDKLSAKLNSEHNALSLVSKTVNELVKAHKLEPHPEGGFYARVFKSTDTIISSDATRYNGETRSAGSAIYYLLNGNDFSAWHRIKSDELWHFYTGSPARIHVIDSHGDLKSYILGNSQETPESQFQVLVKAGDWFAAECLDKSGFCFVGCTVTPGFEFKDFELAKRSHLSQLYPRFVEIVEKFTRVEVSEDKAKSLSHC